MRRIIGFVAGALVAAALVLAAVSLVQGATVPARTLTFEDRVATQRAVEAVYWAHRTWPTDNPGSRPALDAVMPDSAIRAKVEQTLRRSAALESTWDRPITAAQLQAEMNRMARESRNPAMLAELFAALDHDPFLVAECLVRPVLAERMIRARGGDGPAGTLEGVSSNLLTPIQSGTYSLPDPACIGCVDDTWTPTLLEVPGARVGHTAVWTGTEMIVWGGNLDQINGLAKFDGARYDPALDTWTPTSTGANLPTGRCAHSAVWTGHEMLIWGGQESGGAIVSSGGRYDPATDSWRPVSMAAGVPPPRQGHTAVWNGRKMIVWGGIDAAGTALNTGGGYDPLFDNWKVMSTGAGVPSPREAHSAIWSGSEMVVWGGRDSSGNLADGGRYSPRTNSWRTISAAGAPIARSDHTAVWTGRFMIVWGGQGGIQYALNSGAIYNPVSDRWRATSTGANVPALRTLHSALWTGSKMLIWGGYGSGFALATGASFEPLSNTWSPIGSGPATPEPRQEHTAVWTGSEMIVWGGISYNIHPHLYFNTGGRYDPVHDSWVATNAGGAMPSAREGHLAVWSGAEMIIWGGGSSTGGRYDPALDSWAAVSTGSGTPPGNNHTTVVWTGSEMIVWGGSPGLNTGGRYNPASDSWATTAVDPNTPSPRTEHSAVWTGTEMIIWGGATAGGLTDSGGRYDPETDAWTITGTDSNTPRPQLDHLAIWTGSEMIVTGGSSARYDPTTDSWRTMASGAEGEASYRLVVWTGTEMIVWGGLNLYFEAGRYDPLTDSWKSISTGPGSPSPRYAHTTVWTGSELIVWGGSDGIRSLNTGARYDPVTDTWRPTSVGADVPSTREYHSAVWTGSEMIIWGGRPATATGARYFAVPPVSGGSGN